MQSQRPNTLVQIFCDKIYYQRLEVLEENESIQLYLYPFKNINNNTLSFIITNMNRVKSTQTLQSNNNIKFTKQKLLKQHQSFNNSLETLHVLTYIIDEKQIKQLLVSKTQGIMISNNRENYQQINKLLRQCVIITFRLPSSFSDAKDCIYNLQGYKYNPKGKITSGWNYLSNGKITKTITLTQNQKVRNEEKQNQVYSKNQIKTILGQIQSVNILTNNQQLQSAKKNKILEDLQLLGQNFYHSQKFISNPNAILPIINYQIQFLCSVFQGQSCRNNISSASIESNEKKTGNVEHICLNLVQGVQKCEQLFKSKVQLLFKKQLKQIISQATESTSSFEYSNPTLTTMPTKVVNPHIFLKTQFKQKFSQYYIKGLYEYYHYGDHNFNDQGWGCAYRSLQTLLSWFKLQQKLNLLTVPTVSQIQNLIDLIDFSSEHKLSNTTNWIGATEVSWVVKKLTGYDCRILHIKDGKDIVQHAEMFRDHLQNVGTPIMYGGDQYAYSIVGINYSWKLGQILFLILDPHYNGSDKIQKIIEKKGISWRKPQEMFKKGVFYNFCLPIL